jgi:hypothetical protein
MAKEKRSEEPELVSYGGKFTFEDLKIRKLRNGNKVRIVLEANFEAGMMGMLEKLFEKNFDVIFKEYIPEPVDPDPDQERIPFKDN